MTMFVDDKGDTSPEVTLSLLKWRDGQRHIKLASYLTDVLSRKGINVEVVHQRIACGVFS